MREMKDSGIEWIGAIPQDWKTDRLQWHLKEINVSNNPIQTKNILSLTIEAGVIPYAEKGNQGNKAKEDYSQYKIAFPDTLVINSMNVIIGAVGISQYFGCVSSVYYVFEPIEGTDLRYIYYLFTNTGFQKEMRKYAKGILEIRLRISSNDMLKRIVPSPPFKEQRRIADYLNKMCAEIDTVLEKTRASIEEYKKLKQAVITQAVTKGIRGDRPMKDSGIEWIGEIPAEWTASKIKYCTEFAPSCNTSHLSEDSLVTFTPMECIKNGYFENREAHFSALSSSYTQYQDGDIVFAKVTPCFENGNIAIMQGLSAGVGFGSSELFVIRPQSINTEFIFYYLQNDIFKQYACATMTGTGGLKRVSPTFVQNYSVFIPCNEKQLEIVRYLNEKCSGIEVLIAKKQQYLTEIENYKKSLIYEYVTGKKEVLPL